MPAFLRDLALWLLSVAIMLAILLGTIALLTWLSGCASAPRPPRDGEILIPIPDWAETQILDLPDCKG